MNQTLNNQELKQKLQANNFSSVFLDNCYNSKFLSILQVSSHIVGVACVGGLMNHYSIELKSDYYGRGLWRKLFNEIIVECKKSNISFLTGVYKTSNLISIKIHTKLGFKPIFTSHYNKEEGKEVVIILPFNWKGKIIENLMKIFNTRIGNATFGVLFILLRPILKNIVAFTESTMPKIDLKYSINNFEKVKSTMKEINFN